jgi:hypothetical protein
VVRVRRVAVCRKELAARDFTEVTICFGQLVVIQVQIQSKQHTGNLKVIRAPMMNSLLDLAE